VEQGLEPIKERLEKVRSWMVRLGMVMLARVKQFHQNYVEFSTYVDQEIIPMTITLPPGLIEDKVLVEPMASSSTMNEAVRQQQIIGLVDRMTQAYQTMTTMADMGAQQAMMGSPTAMIYAGFLQGYQYLIDRLLTEFKVPNKEIINPPVDAMQAMGQMLIMGAQQALMGPPPGAAPPPGAHPMSPHQINHKSIDLIRRSEGWREYAKYLENEYIRAIEMTAAAKTDRDTVEKRNSIPSHQGNPGFCQSRTQGGTQIMDPNQAVPAPAAPTPTPTPAAPPPEPQYDFSWLDQAADYAMAPPEPDVAPAPQPSSPARQPDPKRNVRFA
jgi:hypothetical protein